MKFNFLVTVLLLTLSDFTQDRQILRKDFELIEGVSITMIWVEPGDFMMGSPPDEPERNAEREKQHWVKIEKGYWLMEKELTQQQWEGVMGSNPSRKKGKNLPVEQVSFFDIQDFLEKVNNAEAKFRLPTEIEWEYACRAGTTGSYAGDRDKMTWHSGNSGNESHLVGSKAPNAWGFYDMHGNVLEWCSDLFRADNTQPAKEGTIRRVQRGGQFSGRVKHSRSADRQSSLPEDREFFAGFRLAMSG